MSEEYEQIVPLKGLAPYVGGKRLLAPTLIDLIDKVPHATYAEPFVGMGGVFFRRKSRPRSEVINDWSQDVSTLFRVLQVHYTAFVEMLRWQITTRAEFERLVNTDPSTLTDLQRAARFFYLQKTRYGGLVTKGVFRVDPGARASFDVTKIVPDLEAFHDRLAGVVIERLPYADMIKRYDRPGTLFFIDPPYVGSEDYYGPGMFGLDDFQRLADLLAAITGRFILTVNDCPLARKVFGQFKVRAKSLDYSLAGRGRSKKFQELIVQNN